MEKTNNLKGIDAIKRAQSLMTESTQDRSSNNKNFKLIKEGADGNIYAIVKEGNKYYIKKSKTRNVEGFDYLLGKTKKVNVMSESYSKAINTLTNIITGLNESYVGECGVSNKKVYENDVELEEAVILGDDLELNETIEQEEEPISLDEMLSEIGATEEMENDFIAELNDMEEYINETLSEKYTLKLDSPKTDTPEDEGMDFDMDFEGDDDTNTGDDFPADDMEGESEMGDDENPFGEPFDAGVEANEEEDPKKFLQQLAGKLATSLRDYQEQNSDDVETKKFVANSILSAVDTEGMEGNDIEDIKKKLDEEPTTDGGEDTEDAPIEDEGGEEDFDMDFEGDETETEEEPLEETAEPFTLNENFNQNLDEYLASIVNPGIFAEDDIEEKSKNMTTEKPMVKPTTTPTETPSRRRAPFQAPQVKPQPKFGK